MRFNTYFLLVFFSLYSFQAISQQEKECNYIRLHQADQWIFGNMAHLDFSLDDPIASTTTSFPIYNGVSCVSDENGELLLFTNGINVWNGNFEVVQYGGGLKGNNFATQSSLIVPNPGNHKQYYVFTVDMYIPPIFNDGVNYSIVDFSGNSGGAVVSKNNHLFSKNSQKIIGTRHANGHDYWVITHGFGADEGNNFETLLIGDTGIIYQQGSNIGYKHEGNENNSAGYMKLSPNGKMLALVVPHDGVVEVFDFNASTGAISNAQPQPSNVGQFDYPFGVEFSADNSKLYVSTSPLGNATNYLYQFDLTSDDPFDNPVIIHQFDISENGANDSLMGALQLGVDGKIYLSKFKRGILGKSNLGIINNPNRPGLACNYNEVNNISNNGLNLNNGESLIGLPNFISSFLKIPHFTYYNQCHHDTTEFQITNKTNINQTNWDFDDPDGELVSNSAFSPTYVFTEPGDYNIELTEIFNDIDYRYLSTVRIHSLPFIDLGSGSDTIYILPNSSVQLDAGKYDAYFWLPGGSTKQYLDVTEEGLYTVTVTDSNCCKNSDMVYVAYANLYFPNAFSPESSISMNKEFKVLGAANALAEYRLIIYNRWGQMLFETNQSDEAWDGKFQGEFVPAGTYVWVSTFKSFESGAQESIDIITRGTVTIVK